MRFWLLWCADERLGGEGARRIKVEKMLGLYGRGGGRKRGLREERSTREGGDWGRFRGGLGGGVGGWDGNSADEGGEVVELFCKFSIKRLLSVVGVGSSLAFLEDRWWLVLVEGLG